MTEMPDFSIPLGGGSETNHLKELREEMRKAKEAAAKAAAEKQAKQPPPAPTKTK